MITKIIAEDAIQKTKKYISNVDKIVIVTHTSPDGDAIGSSLGMYHFLEEMDKQVNIIVPNSFPDFLLWMKGAGSIINYEKSPDIATETIDAAELIFCLDFNHPKRIGNLAPLIRNAEAKKILIDHHLDPEQFCDVTMSYPLISSTSEMIFRIICRMGFFELINKACAESVYTGMMTDTGAFTFNSNNEEIYYIISELLKKGIDKDAIYSKVYHAYSADRIRLMGFITYKNMRIYKQYKTALLTLSKAEQFRFRMRKGDTEGFVNIPMSIGDVVFSVFIREDDDVIRLSFRSKGQFPCNEFAAAHFGGGGHRNAAGGEFHGSLADAIALFESVIPQYQNLLEKN
ncbi:MAG: bifunctional oligoribonuclease/PAP phosphatase NrnA [Dysgonamonadaceae bacterium]|jgi:phosphoesterase RecJ-like protein|nr:bifunctional oligoribonuclease/PAP phosphatase NrnA [Dysgonamonadaceae bacterium]